jgi:uncharacterized protein YdeI (BOF family)
MRGTEIRTILSLGAAAFALSVCAFAQDFNPKPKSPASDELPGKQLIVWTATQKPHAIPVTSPEMYQASAHDQTHAQTMTGTILSQGPDLLFATANQASYRIDINHDNQEELRAFTGQKVRISGNVDQAARSVHVLKIEQR